MATTSTVAGQGNDAERIAGWNDTAHLYSHDASVCDLVASSARRWPDRPAVVDDAGVALTYHELERRANCVAHHLRATGHGPGSVCAYLGDHTPEAIVSLLGILKAGASYVPIDPGWPRKRIAAVLQPLGVRCLVHGREAFGRAVAVAEDVLDIRVVLCPEVMERLPDAEPVGADTVRGLWNHIASHPDLHRSAGFNQRDGVRFASEEVTAYRDHVVSLARAHLPKGGRLAEIGCGTGLILHEFCDGASTVVGLDPSNEALARLRRRTAAAEHPPLLIEGFAHEAKDKLKGPFDLVLLASVVQFFPGAGYLVHVLDQLGELLAPGGRVVLADLVPPEAAFEGLLVVGRDALAALVARTDHFAPPTVLDRFDAGLPAELGARYDAVLTAGTAGGSRVVFRTGIDVPTGAEATPLPRPGPDNLAYVIPTSGSTGVPKSVMVKHRAVVNVIEWLNDVYEVTPEDRLLFTTSFAFDLSVYDIFGVLAAGASIRILDNRRRVEPDVLLDLLEREPITIWNSAPAALSAVMAFARYQAPRRRERRLLVLLSGDWIPVTSPDDVWSAFPGARIVAMGGATEATIWSNHFEVTRVDPSWPSIPYGRPIRNARYYVLDADLAQCRVSIEGDLYIAGTCLSEGYAGAPALTAAKFLPDAFGLEPGGRMYATGDRARWLEDGNLQFLGRRDDQVKIRGHRIELGDVRAALCSCEGVVDGVVLAVGADATHRLVAFVAAPSGPEPGTLRAELATLLPPYMVPSSITVLETLPVGPTGKVDRDALRQLADSPRVRPTRDVGPSATIDTLAELWSSVLGIDGIGPDDNFFALGGHSLIAVQLVVLIQDVFGVAYSVRELFDLATLRELAATVEARRTARTRRST